MSKIEISHFYLGRVSDHEKYETFLEENYGTDDDIPISAFCGSQGEMFIDHDFMERGAREPGQSLEEFFSPYSYANHWLDTLCKIARQRDLTEVNVLLFVSKSEIDTPRSVSGDGFDLHYVGEIEYPI